jgi:beta-N-acetylhexosaminidase
VRALDERLPASLSALVLQQLLRRHAGFAGVVVSDDLEMEAVAARWRPGPAAVLAVRAGCDVVAVCKRPDAQVEALEALVHAGESGELSWKEADAALSRIRALKDRFALQNTDPDPRRARLAAGRPEHRALADEIAARAGLRA